MDPRWLKNKIRTSIKKTRKQQQQFFCENNSKLHLQFLQEYLSTSTESYQERHYSQIAKKSNNMQKNSKSCWSLMKFFLINNKKIPLIHSLFDKNPFTIYLKEKGKFFGCFFSKQCSLIVSLNKLPTSQSCVIFKRLSTIIFSVKGRGKINKNPDHSKAFVVIIKGFVS